MFQIIKALLQDTASWALLALLGVTVVFGLTSLFNRYDRFDRYQSRLYLMEFDIVLLEAELDRKKVWSKRLESDPTAWEQVAREKMNYLGPDEILVTFVPGR